MFGPVKNMLRRRRIRKSASNVQTGFIPLAEKSSVNVVIDAEEPDFDKLKGDILAWGRKKGLENRAKTAPLRKMTARQSSKKTWTGSECLRAAR